MALAANLLLVGLAALAPTAPAAQNPGPGPQMPPPPPACPRVPTGVMVGGALVNNRGHALVRWFPVAPAMNSSAAPDAGQYPTFEIRRQRANAPMELVATLTRAQTEAEAQARLLAAGGNDVALLTSKAAAIDPQFGGTLLGALAVLERPQFELARNMLATQSWRIAWALGMAWLDTDLKGSDVMVAFTYEVKRLPFLADPAWTLTTVPKVYVGADLMPQPTGMDASTIEDLEDSPGVPMHQSDDGTDWARMQRLRWAHLAIRVAWDVPPEPPGCNDAPPTKWGAGFDLFRRHCTALDANNACLAGVTVQVNDPTQPIYPMAPDPECKVVNGQKQLDAKGHCTAINDTANHVVVRAFHTDNSTALQVGEVYCYKVRQRNLLGVPGLWSAEGCADALDTTPPAPPGDFHLSLLANKPFLQWTQPQTVPTDPNEPPVPEVVAKYEVWRTKVLRQDLLPALSPLRWKNIAFLGPLATSYLDADPAIQEGEHYWYKVRAFDDAKSKFVPTFQGNPSAFTRPLSIGPKDLTPPRQCSAGTPLAQPVCINLPFPGPGGPVLAGQGCISFAQPVDPQYRRVLWFHGDDDAGTNLHLVKVFHNVGQTLYCNDLDLPWDLRLCVKLQGEDAVGNRGPAALSGLPCHYPSFSLVSPPPPKPVITQVLPVDPGNPVVAKVAWDAAAQPWLKEFHLLESSTPTPSLDSAGCPVDFNSMFLKTMPAHQRSTTEPLVPPPTPGEPFLIYYVVAAETFDGQRACSLPVGYSPGSVLPKPHHPLGVEEGDLNFCQIGYSQQQGGVVLRWHWGPPNTHCLPPLQAWFVVYRSLRPDRDFVAITPPISGNQYVDKSTPDARYHYQVAFVAHDQLPDGTLVDGEVRDVTPPTQPAGPKPAWPEPHDTQGCAPQPPGFWQTTLKKLFFGTGDRRFTMDLCYYKHEPVNALNAVNLGLDSLGPVVQQAPPQLQPQGEAAVQALRSASQSVPQAVSPNVPNPAPVTISGSGLVRVELPGLGVHTYRHGFTNLTVVPGIVQQGTPSATVVAGQLTHATAAPGVFPLHTPSHGDTLFRLRVNGWTLDKDGARASLHLRAPDSVRFTVVPSFPTDKDLLGLGVVELTPKFEFRKTVVVGGSPDQCAGPLRFSFDLTNLPLRVRPAANFTLTQAGMTSEDNQPTVPLCTSYLDPYTPDPGDPQHQPPRQVPPVDRRDVDTNDAILRPGYTGSGKLRPNGIQANLATPGPLSWVTSVPFGFHVQAGGASLSLIGGNIVSGGIGGPITVDMAYRVGPDVPHQEVQATFPGAFTMTPGGALAASGGTVDVADLPFGNGGLKLKDLKPTLWTAVLGRIQTARTVAAGSHSDDHGLNDGQGPLSNAWEVGLNYIHAPFTQKFLWKCIGSAAPAVTLDTRVDVYLRLSGLSHEVEADIPLSAPKKIDVRGYPALLLRFHAMYLDSVMAQPSDIRVMLKLPFPAELDVPLFHVQLDPATNCVRNGDAPDGLELKARAWHLPLAPQSGEFRTRATDPEDPAAHDTCAALPPAVPAPPAGHCPQDWPHWQFWLLGEADLPHLHDAHPLPPGAPAGWQGVRFDQAWEPTGQAGDSFTVAPMLRLDGFNFTASQVRLSRAHVVRFCESAAAGPGPDPAAEGPLPQACVPGNVVFREEDEQPSTQAPAWHGGNLVPPPCPGTDPGQATDRTGRCPPFLRYVGHLQLPYWAQSTAPLVVTAFVHGVRNQTSDGSLAPQPMHHAHYLGIAQAPEFVRGWTEASGVPDQQLTLRYAQQPHAFADFDATLGEHPPEQAIWVGFADSQVFGGTSTQDAAAMMDVGTVASTIVPCASGGCDPGDPDVQLLQGIPAGVGVLRATADVLHPGASGPGAMGSGPGSPPDVASQLGLPFGGAAELAGLAELWGPMSLNCAHPMACYLQAKPAADAALQAAQDAPGGGGPEMDSGLSPWLAALQAAGGNQGQLVTEWDLGIGHMRSTVFYTETAHGDFRFDRIEAIIKFDDTSGSNFVTAERVVLVIDNEGVLTITGEDVQSVVLDFLGDPTIDFHIRLEGAPSPRFDGGISVYGVEFGTVSVKYVHGVFGAGVDNDFEPILYFGISGEGSESSSGVTVGLSLLVGTIDATSKPILVQHGFAELVEYLNTGDTGGADKLIGVYSRAYAQIPIYGSGCMLSINGGAEIGLWYFDASGGSASVDSFVFGSKLRAFATGNLLCIVTIRGDITIWLQITDQGTSAGGEGWVAGGIGFCSSETWTSWDAHWWDDDWCFICGQHLEFIYNSQDDDFDVSGTAACG